MLVRRFVCNNILLLCLSGTILATGCHDVAHKEICGTNVTFIPNLSTRGPDTVVTEELFQWKYCDVYAIDHGMWYHSNTPMTTTCPDMYMCGTKFPVWLQGENPIENEGIVNLTACLRDFDTCCLRTYSISAVNCGETMAYCFNELPSGCHQRYCFDVNESSTNPYQELATSTKPMTTSDGTQTTSPMHSPINQHTTDKPLESTFAQSEHSTNPIHMLAKSTPRGNVHIGNDKDTNTITILMACIGVLLVTVIALLVAFVLRRRVKPSRISDTHDNESKGDVETIKTLHGLLPNDLKFDPNSGYETLNSRYITLDYAPLNKVYLESFDKSTKIGHEEELSGAGLYGLLGWSSAELKENGSPTKTDEEAHYQALP